MYGLLNIMAGGQRPAPVPPTPTLNWFYVEDASGAANTVMIKRANVAAPTLTIETSTDGNTWTTAGTTSTSGLNITVPANGKVYLRCNATGWAITSMGEGDVIRATGNFNVGGNIMSLLYGSNFDGTETTFPSGSQYTFLGLFHNAGYLVDASALLLPATTLSNCCYKQMFDSCGRLTSAPVLPATTLASNCYNNMFRDCRSLNAITCLATSLATYSTSGWVRGVAATGTFTKAASMSSWTTGIDGIPSGWTVLDA